MNHRLNQTINMYVIIDGHDVLADACLNVSVEQIDVTPLTKVEPNMKWTMIDASGHFHAFSTDEDHPLPTLIRKEVSMTETDEEGDEWESAHVWYECVICAEQIEPLWTEIPVLDREIAPGQKSWIIEATANGPGAVIMNTKRNERVSVQISTDGNETEIFGVGQLVTDSIGQGHFGFTRWTGRVLGIGPLGRRDA